MCLQTLGVRLNIASIKGVVYQRTFEISTLEPSNQSRFRGFSE